MYFRPVDIYNSGKLAVHETQLVNKTNIKTMAFEFTDSNFEETALSGGVAIVDFWAEWCGPCKMVTPIIDELSTDYEGKATIGKVNVDDNPEVSMKYGVRSIPTILFIKDGEVVDKHVGVATKASLEQKLAGLLEGANA